MSRSRSTSTPQGGSPTGAIDASTAPGGRRLRARQARGESHEVGHQRGGMQRGPGRRWPAGTGSGPSGPRASSGLRAAPRPGTPARSAARTPGPRRRRSGCPSRRRPARPGPPRPRSRPPRRARPRSARRRGPSRSPSGTRSPSPASAGRGPRSCPCLPGSRRAGRPAATGPSGCRPRISGPSDDPKGSLPVSWRARRMASVALVSCWDARGVVGGDVVGGRGRRAREVLLLEGFQGPPVPVDEDELGDGQRDDGSEDQRAGKKDEKADPAASGTPTHDSDIIAAAASHSSGGTVSSTRARPISASRTEARPRAVDFLSRARKGASRARSRSGSRKRAEGGEHRAHRGRVAIRAVRRARGRSRARPRCPTPRPPRAAAARSRRRPRPRGRACGRS